MSLSFLAADWAHPALWRPTTVMPALHSLRRDARYALWMLRSRLRRSRHAVHDELAADSPMLLACYETHRARCQMGEVFASLRGDEVADALP